jgi:integrase
MLRPIRLSVAQFLGRWLNHIRTQVEPGTYERYFEFCTNNIIPALGAVRLTKLRPEQISDAYSQTLADGRRDGRKGGLAPRTVHHMHAIFKQALAQACVWRAISHNPAALVKPPKVGRSEMRTLDTDATAKMIEAAQERSYLFRCC